jgi:hypothetical protein
MSFDGKRAEGDMNYGDRVDVARLIHKYWTAVDAEILRLSPREIDWIVRERSAPNVSRRIAAADTREYHLYKLGLLIDQCLIAARDLSDADIEFEMYAWTKVATCYHESSIWMKYHMDGAGLESIAWLGVSSTLGDILNVSLPSAMIETMGWPLLGDQRQ